MRYRPNGSVIASIAIHVVVAAAVLQVLVTPRHFDWVFTSRADVEPTTERLRYIVVAPAVASAPSGIAGTPGRPPVRRPPAVEPAPLVAPVVIPEGIPAPPPAAAAPPPPPIGIGAGTGGDSSARGTVALIPGGGDSRIWAPPPPYVPPNLSPAEVLQQSLARGIKAANDSAAAVAAVTRRPGDWTVDRGGGKYGIDSERIYFGKYSVPSAILALLPIRGAQGNPNIAERAERITEMSGEIRARSSLELDARDEIKRINARKDRERAARLRAAEEAKKKAASPPPGPAGASSLPPPP